jgi:hypothetical protein
MIYITIKAINIGEIMKNTMIKALMIILTFVSTLSFAETEQIGKDNKDLTQFDYPFMLGTWNIVKHMSRLPQSVSFVMKFNSDYTYSIQLTNVGELVIDEKGTFSVKDDTEITLVAEGKEVQVYPLRVTQDKLMMNGMYFTKENPVGLSGIWNSIKIEQKLNSLNNVMLLLTKDFIFRMRVSSADGRSKMSEGIYIIDNEKIMFMTQKGESLGSYKIEDNLLKLDLENGDLYSELARIQ